MNFDRRYIIDHLLSGLKAGLGNGVGTVSGAVARFMVALVFPVIVVTVTGFQVASPYLAADDTLTDDPQAQKPPASGKTGLGSYRQPLSWLMLKWHYPGYLLDVDEDFPSEDALQGYQLQHVKTLSDYGYDLKGWLLTPVNEPSTTTSSATTSSATASAAQRLLVKNGCLVWLHREDETGSEIIEKAARFGSETDLLRYNWNILIPEYPGYSGTRHQKTLAPELESMVRAWRDWCQDKGYNQTNTALFGHSLGSLVATYWAVLNGAAALIADSPFIGIAQSNSYGRSSCMACFFKWMYDGYLNVAPYLSGLQVPTLVIARNNSRCCPSQLSEDFYDELSSLQKKQLIRLNAGDDLHSDKVKARYVNSIRAHLLRHAFFNAEKK